MHWMLYFYTCFSDSILLYLVYQIYTSILGVLDLYFYKMCVSNRLTRDYVSEKKGQK